MKEEGGAKKMPPPNNISSGDEYKYIYVCAITHVCMMITIRGKKYIKIIKRRRRREEKNGARRAP